MQGTEIFNPLDYAINKFLEENGNKKKGSKYTKPNRGGIMESGKEKNAEKIVCVKKAVSRNKKIFLLTDGEV